MTFFIALVYVSVPVINLSRCVGLLRYSLLWRLLFFHGYLVIFSVAPPTLSNKMNIFFLLDQDIIDVNDMCSWKKGAINVLPQQEMEFGRGLRTAGIPWKMGSWGQWGMRPWRTVTHLIKKSMRSPCASPFVIKKKRNSLESCSLSRKCAQLWFWCEVHASELFCLLPHQGVSKNMMQKPY